MTTQALDLDVRPTLPREPAGLGIGLIGAGGVVEHGHMPAYRKAGFSVVAVASRSPETARQTARRWNIPHACDDWRQVIDLPSVRVVDVSFPFDEDRFAIVAAAAQAGKHILMEKPLAHTREAALAMTELAERHGVLLAVNQNARWCPQHLAVKRAVEAGLLGPVHFLLHEMQSNQDSQPWFQSKWYARQPRFQLMEYSVHHLDLLRWWAGAEPTAVKAIVARKAGQQSRGEMIASVLLEFPGRGMGVMVDNNASHPRAEPWSRFRVEGSRGVVEGGGMGRVGFRLLADELGDAWQTLDLPGGWFPDGFVGTMGELLSAVEDRREPGISARDNLKTLDLVFRAYESVQTASP